MTPPMRPPDDHDGMPPDPELEEWLAGLRDDPGASPSPSAALGSRLRRVVLDDFQTSVDEVRPDELREGWRTVAEKLESQSGSAGPGWLERIRSIFSVSGVLPPQALATGVMGLILGGLLTPLVMHQGSVAPSGADRPELILSVGELETSRGAVPTQSVKRAVTDPVDASSVFVEDLMLAGIGFKVYRVESSGEQQVVFTLAGPVVEPLATTLSKLGIDSSGTGVVMIHFVPE